MPSKRDAERATGLFAVKKLHESKELNDRFLMAPPVDSDDEDVQKEKRKPLAGTEKRARLYRNRVCIIIMIMHCISICRSSDSLCFTEVLSSSKR